MTFATAVKSSLRKWRQLSGRASRKEYISFNVFVTLALIASLIVLPLIVVWPLLLIPSFAVQVRRAHDLGRSGWIVLLTLIPYVGVIFDLVLVFAPSQPGDNKYGPHPYRPGEVVLAAPANWAPPPEGSAPGAMWAAE